MTDDDKHKIENSKNNTEPRPWMNLAGNLRHLHSETMRVRRAIEEEFEQIEPDDGT